MYDPQDDEFVELAGGEFPIGLVETAEYGEYEFPGVRAGQVFFAATDGVWETRGESGELFGKDRVRDLLRETATLSAEEIGARVRAALTSFRGEASQLDDITFVVVKVL